MAPWESVSAMRLEKPQPDQSMVVMEGDSSFSLSGMEIKAVARYIDHNVSGGLGT